VYVEGFANNTYSGGALSMIYIDECHAVLISKEAKL